MVNLWTVVLKTKTYNSHKFSMNLSLILFSTTLTYLEEYP